MKEYERDSGKLQVVKNFAIDGIGYFLDCYDSFMLPYFTYYINAVYFSGDIPYIYDCLLRTAAPIGSLFIKLVLQIFPLKVSHPIPNIGLILVMASSLGISLAGNGKGINFIAALVFWRFLMGIGLALENPFQAVINLPSAETSTTPKLLMKAVYLSLTCAIILGYIVSMSFSAGFKSLSNNQVDFLDYAWRICEGSVFIPAAIALYCRMIRSSKETTMKEVKCREEIVAENRLSRATTLIEDNEPLNFTWSDSFTYFSKLKNFINLVGGMFTIFITNLIFWGYAWNLGAIFFSVGFVDPNSEIGAQNFTVAIGVVIVAFGGIPGFLASTVLIERIGRKNLTLIGFGGMLIINTTLGFGFNSVKSTSPIVFILLMALENAFVQLAPNGTSFTQFRPSMLAPELEPSPNGYYGVMMISGLIASQFLFIYTKDIGGPSAFISHIYQLYSILSILGLLVTLLLPNPQPFEKRRI
jgi:MFS family permease